MVMRTGVLLVGLTGSSCIWVGDKAQEDHEGFTCSGSHLITSSPETEEGVREDWPDVQVDSDISALADCQTIEGFLMVDSSSLTNVDDLSKLTSVGLGMFFSSNGALTNLDGLSSLASVGGQEGMELYDNDTLTDVDGLSSLTEVDGRLLIGDNDALDNVDGLASLTSFSSSLFVENNGVLTNLDGLSGLTALEDLAIAENSLLASLDGLSACPSDCMDCYIVRNDSLCASAVDAWIEACGLEDWVTAHDNDSDC